MAFYLVVSAILATLITAHPELPYSYIESPTYSNLTSCSNEPSFYSCQNTSVITNTCCSPTPGGLVLQAQYWDTNTGYEKENQLLPKNSWTIHGLWPDNCDGFVELVFIFLL